MSRGASSATAAETVAAETAAEPSTDGAGPAVARLTDSAAEAAIGAACRALHLPTVRAEAGRIADAAGVPQRSTVLASTQPPTPSWPTPQRRRPGTGGGPPARN